MKRNRRWVIALSLILIPGIIPALEAQGLQLYGRVDVRQLPPPGHYPGKLNHHKFYVSDPSAFHGKKAAAESGFSSPSIAGPVNPTASSISIGPGGGFAGMSLGDSSLLAVPPDTQVAAGAGYVVEAVNVDVRIWNMNVSPPTVTDFDLISFFGLFFSDVVSDPRIRFDPVQQRWYISCVSIEETFANPPQGEFRLAVSPGSDPTQMFALYALTTINSFPDFPHVGFNDDKLVLTGNSYSLPLSSAQFLGTEFLVVNKSDLMNPAIPSPRGKFYAAPQGLDTIEPAESLSSTCGSGVCTLFMAAVPDASLPPPANILRIWSLQGVPGVGAGVSFTTMDLSIPLLSIPPRAEQQGSANLIETNDARLLDAIYRNGSLWVTSSTGCQPSGDTQTRSCLHFSQVNTSPITLAQDFVFGQPGMYFYYPAIQIDSNNSLVAVFNQSSSTEYPSIYASGQPAGAAPGTFSAPVSVFEGQFPLTPSSPEFNRWGDYSGAGLDSSGTIVWVAAEYVHSASSDDWGTWISPVQLSVAGPTTTTLGSVPNPSTFGQQVTFTATVTSGAGTPTGAVTFKDGTTTLGTGTLDGSGQATLGIASLSVGSHSITAVYGGDSNFAGSTSPAITQTVNPSGGALAFLTGYALNGPPLRNGFSGFVGMKFTVGTNALSVSALGRIFITGNSGTHTVKLVQATNGTDVPGGSVSVSMVGGVAGQFKYVALGSPVTLQANTAYYLVTQEANGGDQWYDTGTVSSTAAGAVNNSIYSYDSVNWNPYNTVNTSYVPANFQYALASLNPDLTIVKSHSGNFTQGDTGDTYSLTVTNSGGAATSGTVTVNDTVPAGLTATAISGTNWSCTQPAGPCTRSDALNPSLSYPVITLTVNVAGNAPASVTNTATVSGGGELNTGNDSASDPTIVNPLGGALAFLTGYALNGPPLRNNFGGFVGMKFTVGTNALSVSALGRIFITGNSGTHTVKLVQAATGTDVPGGSVSVSMVGGVAGQFKYVSLGSPVTLQANTAYYLVTQEANGGDQWYDTGTVSSTAAGAVNNSIYSYDSVNWNPYNTVNTSYVPANFQYALASLNPDLTIVKSHSGNFTQGDTGKTYSLTVTNSGGAATSGTVTVNDTVPAGLTATAISGTNWSCTQPAGPCTRSDALNAGLSYPAITLTVNVAGNAPASVTNTATVSGGGELNTGNDSASDPTIVNPLGGALAFLTGYALNGPPLRNNFSGFVGMRFTVGSSALTVSALGRIFITGNSGTHTVKLVLAANGTDVPGGSVAVSMVGGVAGQFKYVSLGSPVTLQANTAYYLVTQEANGGDQWYDTGTVSSTAAGAVNNSIYSYDSVNWNPYNTVNTSYVPANFQYH